MRQGLRGDLRPPYRVALRLIGWAVVYFAEFELLVFQAGVVGPGAGGRQGTDWLNTLPPRLACNVIYGHTVSQMDAEARQEYDVWLWSDPAREEEILSSVTTPDPAEVA